MRWIDESVFKCGISLTIFMGRQGKYNKLQSVLGTNS